MSEQDFITNPFAALFPTLDDAEKFRGDVPVDHSISGSKSDIDMCLEKQQPPEDMQVSYSDEAVIYPSDAAAHKLSHALEDIFCFTLSKDVCCDKDLSCAIFLRDVYAAMNNQTFLDVSCIERALFERLLLDNPQQHVIYKKKYVEEESLEKIYEAKKVFYLYECYFRALKSKDLKVEEFSFIKSVIVTQLTTAVSQPEMFPDDKFHEDLIEIILKNQEEIGHPDILADFFVEFATNVVQSQDASLNMLLKGPFAYLQEKIAKSSIVNRNLFTYLDVIHYFTKSPSLTLALLQFCTPLDIKNGRAYQNSLIGLPMGMSCLPKSEQEPYEFFQDPSRYSSQEHTITEESLWLPMSALSTHMHKLFYNILCQSSDTRNALLKWLGDCLSANSGRSKLWNSQVPELFSSMNVSDGFVLNLEAVLLKLCKPFSEPFSPKLLKIDPTYCVAEQSSTPHSCHFRGLSNETSLLPRDENFVIPNRTYNFTTECFFATHHALRIGFHVANEKMLKINQDLARFQRIYEDLRQNSADSSDTVEQIKTSMEKGTTRFLTYRTALLVPEILDAMFNFHTATATWLVNICTSSDGGGSSPSPITFPLLETVSPKWACIPEFVLENIADCILFIKRFSPKNIEMSGDMLDHLMTLIIVLMGSPARVKNPHLRAQLAEMLEALMPFQEDEYPVPMISCMYRDKLFTSHPLIGELVPTLLNVFVSIEMTGQSVAFEQKFQYRRPMYIVLDYIRKFDLHKLKMKTLAEDAEKNIESSHPPLFLHFINLLINDAIFLLDEALSTMCKLRELQRARDSGSWDQLSPEQIQQQESNFQHLGLLAKFHNVMSNSTIHTLQWLTLDIKSIFCHPTIVERITAMLNYFLLHLVGPQKKNLKVKDLNEYEFKPQELVTDICRLYQNLGAGNEQIAENFCLAVSKDGRSYSPDLFPQAQAVLYKIGHSLLANDLDVIAKTVQTLAIKQQRIEERLTEAPEDFLDPIMNTVMMDPVKLPSSGVIIDRQTIARHLLSDQTDPFNRSPLTMDMVIPDVEMKTRIQEWMLKMT